MTPAGGHVLHNNGGVGKTSLVYHVAWMMARKGYRVLAADLDPQANLTAHFLDEEDVADLWLVEQGHSPRWTVYGSLEPLVRAVGDVATPRVMEIADRLDLVPGDMVLSSFEDELSSAWPGCLDRKERSFRVISAFWRLLIDAAGEETDVVLVDVGPNLGAINRAAMVAADHVVIPLGPDLFSVQGLQNLGPTLRRWRAEWAERVAPPRHRGNQPSPPPRSSPTMAWPGWTGGRSSTSWSAPRWRPGSRT
jgi:chromosome partitioning protein